MRFLKRVLIGLCVSILILLPAVGYVMDSGDQSPVTVQGDASVKSGDEGSQDTPQSTQSQDEQSQKPESESTDAGQK
jgi:hypothetical protein